MSASLVLSPREEYEGGSLQMILNDCIDRNNVVTPHDVEDQEQGTLIIFPSFFTLSFKLNIFLDYRPRQ